MNFGTFCSYTLLFFLDWNDLSEIFTHVGAHRPGTAPNQSVTLDHSNIYPVHSGGGVIILREQLQSVVVLLLSVFSLSWTNWACSLCSSNATTRPTDDSLNSPRFVALCVSSMKTWSHQTQHFRDLHSWLYFFITSFTKSLEGQVCFMLLLSSTSWFESHLQDKPVSCLFIIQLNVLLDSLLSAVT